jgi:hypothetical protein
MPSRKRAADEMEVEAPAEEPSTLQKLRNMWQFANLAQYISLFGDAVKIDKDLDIEVRQLAPNSTEAAATCDRLDMCLQTYRNWNPNASSPSPLRNWHRLV